MNRTFLFVGGLVSAFFSLHIVVRLLPLLRFFVYTFYAGVLATVIGYLSLVVLTVRSNLRKEERSGIHNIKPLPFTHPSSWGDEIEVLAQLDSIPLSPLYPQSFLISDNIGSLVELVIENFVNSWYKTITTDLAFINHLSYTLRHVLANVRDRFLQIDTVELVVGRIVPLLTNHLSDFSAAEKVVRGIHLNKRLTESEELDLAIAGKYRDGKLHPAASLAFSDSKLAQQDHLRAMVDLILPLVMPETEMKSNAVAILLRELIACALLAPFLVMLSDPDTWNQSIVAVGKTALEDRKNVQKLRAALDKHASLAPRWSRVGDYPQGSSRTVPFIRLSPTDDERSFEQFIRYLQRCNNLSDARRMRSEISSQLMRDVRVNGEESVHIKRLESGKRLLDQKVANLSAGSTGEIPSRQLNVMQSHPRRVPTHVEPAKLVDILRDPSGLSYFMEHMDRQNRLSLVQFWLVVDGLRDPLEDDIDEDDDQSTALTNWTESDRNDIAQIYEAYFSKPELCLPEKTRDEVRAFLKAGPRETPSQYHKARAAILRTQTAVLEDMQHRDLVSFRNSDIYYKYLASDDFATGAPATAATRFARGTSWIDNPTQSSRSVDVMISSKHSSDAHSPKEPYGRWGEGSISNSVQNLDETCPGFPDPSDMSDRNIVEAMEAVLNDIIEKPGDDQGLPQYQSGFMHPDSPGSFVDVLNLDKGNAAPKGDELFKFNPGRKGKVLPPSIASLGLVNPYIRGEVFSNDELFPDEDFAPESETEHESVQGIATNSGEEEEIHVALPGDLGLAEAITHLTYDIEKLQAQEVIVDSLTRKAELTNNISELQILRKSKASLQREIRRKELQRQQYIVQESDNSLFGRSSIHIQNSIVGKENGKEYALYIIEVHRESSQHMPVAQWVVARRYSEFYDLHQKLRAIFSLVRDLDFPRRRVVLYLQKDFLEKRRVALEKYLKSLLLIPDVCRSRDFRAFLSARSIAPVLDATNAGENGQDFISRLYSSISGGVEDVLGNLPLPLPIIDQLSTASTSLITSALQTYQATNGGTLGGSLSDTAEAEAEAEAELAAFDNATRTGEQMPFVKPICDLFLETFELNQGKSWLRGRAVVIVLHQLLGGTIEKRVREHFRVLSQEDSVLKNISLIKAAIVQNSAPRPSRTEKEKLKSKNEAEAVLATLVPDMAASVVGKANSVAAGRRLFVAFNNQRLNTSIVFTILDELINAIFKELKDSI